MVEQRPRNSAKTRGRDAQDNVQVAVNAFEILELEEPKFTAPASNKTALKSTQKQPKKCYDIESAYDGLLTSSVFFFQDLKEIREYVSTLWGEYKSGLVDLTTASMVVSYPFFLYPFAQLFLRHRVQVNVGTDINPIFRLFLPWI